MFAHTVNQVLNVTQISPALTDYVGVFLILIALQISLNQFAIQQLVNVHLNPVTQMQIALWD